MIPNTNDATLARNINPQHIIDNTKENGTDYKHTVPHATKNEGVNNNTKYNNTNMSNIHKVHNEKEDIKLSNKQLNKISKDIINIVFHSEDDYQAQDDIIEKIKEIILLNDTAKHIESLKNTYTLSPEEKDILQSQNKEEVNPIDNINANIQKP